MAWERLKTDYKDAVWSGLRKFIPIDNGDGSYSVKDVTQYTVYDESFFGAYDANRINTAVNAEFCKGAYGSPQGEDGNNTYAWSATSNTARTACGNVKNAVSATNVRDLVGNVWKWLDEFIHDPTGSAWNWYDVMSGQKVGQLYMANNTGLHALVGGGGWNGGVRDGSRTVHCSSFVLKD